MRSLVVDDSVASQLVLQNILQPLGPCDTAQNGLEAVEAYRESLEADQPYDLICLDIVMPAMDGQEALKEIRTLEASRGIWGGDGVKVIMVTAVDDPQNLLEAYTEDCHGYIVKPIAAKKVKQALAALDLIEQDSSE